MNKKQVNDWDEVLSAAARLQGHLTEAVLVGGTASALFAAHRTSYDADHVLPNLREEFDDILANLESVAGWQTARTKKPVLILGKLDGIETGVRQLIRSEPLETTNVFVRGQKITVPTEGEILRIKAALILKRNATRDYLDFAALSDHMGGEATGEALKRLDELYPQPSGESALQQLYMQLANPKPFDLQQVHLAEYKNLAKNWQDWDKVAEQCRLAACTLLDCDSLIQRNEIKENGPELEQQAMEIKTSQEHLANSAGAYNTILQNYTEVKLAQCERLEEALTERVAEQQAAVTKCEKQRPGAIRSLWCGAAWQKEQATRQTRLKNLEQRLSRVQGIKADTQKIAHMAEMKLRRGNEELTRQRDAHLKSERKKRLSVQERTQSQKAQQRHSRGLVQRVTPS